MQTYRVMLPSTVNERWGELRPLLARAVAHCRGEVQVDDLLMLVNRNVMGILALEEDGEVLLASAFEVLRYPRRTVLNFAYVGGSHGIGIVQNIEVLYDVARTLGADTLSCMCRPGVARRIRQLVPQAEQAYLVVELRVPPQETVQ
jgi:hypothetical protein